MFHEQKEWGLDIECTRAEEIIQIRLLIEEVAPTMLFSEKENHHGVFERIPLNKAEGREGSGWWWGPQHRPWSHLQGALPEKALPPQPKVGPTTPSHRQQTPRPRWSLTWLLMKWKCSGVGILSKPWRYEFGNRQLHTLWSTFTTSLWHCKKFGKLYSRGCWCTWQDLRNYFKGLS